MQAEYWHDPLQEAEYRDKSVFLADINNEKVVYICEDDLDLSPAGAKRHLQDELAQAAKHSLDHVHKGHDGGAA